MFLKSLKLTNFRNYKNIDFKFKTKVTVLTGNNASGKSNFLESIAFLSTAKSPKADKEIELINSNENYLRVEGKLDSKINLEIVLQNISSDKIYSEIKKKVKVNHLAKRVTDYAETLAVVLFSPDDINLVIGSPSLRRYYLDLTISQVDKTYKKALSNYENILTRKNKILKSIREGFGRVNELDFWYEEQIKFGQVLTEKRLKFFEFINQRAKRLGNYRYLFYSSNLSFEKLTEYQSREIESATSLIGPHRDDFTFLLNEIDLAKFGSRGEQRTAILDLKLSEVDFFEDILKSRPILLLDDIFSELDLTHKKHVIEIISMQQTILAAVDIDPDLQDEIKQTTFWTVENGQISEKAEK